MMFKNILKPYILSTLCVLALAFPQLVKAQTLNQSIVVTAAYATGYPITTPDFDFNNIMYASSGLPITYSSNNNAVATIVGNKIHPVGVGTFVLTVSQPGNATYFAAPDLVVTLTIGKGLQTITFPTIPSKSISDVDFDPGATSSSGLAITYTSSNSAVATIVANQIHIIGLGTTSITASQAGNANFVAATTETRSFNVSSNTQTITFAPINKTYLDPNFTPFATSSAGLSISYYTSSNPAVATIQGNSTVRIIGAGTSTITAFQDGTTTYQGANGSTTLTVAKANQNIFFSSSASKAFNTPDYDPAGVASSNLAVTYISSNPAVATIVANKIHITGAGTTVITASQVGNTNYNAATDVAQTLTITKANQTITFPDIASKPLGIPDFDPGATSSSGLPVVYTSSNPAVATIVANQIHIVGLGATTITATQPGDANNNAATSVIKSLTVSGSAQVITFPAILPKTIGDPDFNPGATASSGLPITYTSADPTVATIVGNFVHITGSGTTLITANQVGDSNYAGTSSSVNLTVNKKNQTISFGGLATKLRSDADFNPGATASSELAITYTSSNPAVALIVNNLVRLVGAGSTMITANQAGDNSFNAATPISQNLTVNKGVQVITFPNISPKTPLDVDFDPGSTSNSGLQTVYTSSNPAVATIIGRLVHIVGAGNTIITSSQAGDANYEPASLSRTLFVNALVQTFNFPPLQNVEINIADFDPGATTNSGLPIAYTSSNLAVATIVANKIHVVGVGRTSITASQAGNGTYAPTGDIVRSLTVTKILQTITFPVIPVKTLGDADFASGAAINSPLSMVFTSSNTDVATVVGGVIHIVGAGTTTITASQPGDANYEAATNISRLLTVNGNTAQIVLIPAITDKPFGSPDFNPGAVSNSGLPITYTSSNPAVATIVNNNIHLVGIGATTITASQAGSVNFAAASVSTPLNVIKGTPVIFFPGIPAKIVSNLDFDPFANTTTGLTITYSSSDPAVATIVSNKVHLVGVGTAIITASVVGNANYNASSADQTLVVGKGFQIINFPAIAPVTPSSADFNPGATVASGLPITYTSSDPTVATIVANKIHVVGLGTAIITASQPGDVNYNAATDVSRQLTISKGFQNINFPILSAKSLATADFDPGATVASGLPLTYTSSNPAVATIVLGKIHVVGLGSTTITASQPGDVNYNAATDVSRQLFISGTDQIITFATSMTRPFGTPDFAPDAIASSGLELQFTSSNPAVAVIFENKIRITGVGTAVITANQFGNSIYSGASAISSLTVTKANQVINFPPIPDKHRNDPDFVIGATSSANLTVFYTSSNPSVATVIGNQLQITGIGTAVISAAQPGDGNYNPATVVNQTLTVLKGTQTITFPEIPVKSLSDVDFDPGATTNSGVTITYSSTNINVATIVNGKVHIVGLGTATIIASAVGNANYEAATSNKVLTVRGLSQTITFNAIANKKLTDVDFDPGATVSTGLPIVYTSSNLAVATIIGNKVHIVGAGTTTITATQAGDATYAPVTASVTLTVDGNAQTITFPAINAKELTSADFEPGATASSGLAITYTSADPTVATIVANKIHIVGVGSTTITATQVGNATFAAAVPVSVQLVVNKTAQTITFPAIALKTPTDADFDLNATASSGLTVSYSSSNTAVATIVAGKAHIVGSGSAVITASQLGDATYNAATAVSQTLDVVYTLPVSNFTVKATDETCKTSNNGAINISAVQALNYTASITVNGTTTTYPFSTVLAINNLQAGTYNVCITVAGQPNYKQCFDLTVKEPKDLAVYSSIKNDGNTVLLKLEGSEQYRIELNGQVITTKEQEISLPLVKGNNIVKISSDLTCQGVITKTFLTTNAISLYPNPVKSTLNITTGLSESNAVKVDIHALDGRLVHSSQHRAEYGQVGVDLSKLNKGLYVLTLTIGNSKTVHKIIKD